MKEGIISATVICSALAAVTIASAFERSDYNIRLGNDNIIMQYPSFVQNNRLYVSIRNLCEALGIPVYWNDDENEVHVDIYNKKVPVSDKTEYKEEGVIPDEEMALTIGKAILEKYAGEQMEYETEDKIYYLNAEFLEQYNAWRIYQTFEYKNGGVWNVGDDFYSPTVTLSKSSGEVIFINTYSMFNN